MRERPAYPPARWGEIVSWAMFDFANSSYTTIIVSVAFAVYFARLVVPGEGGDFLWSVGISLGNLVVLLLSPMIGAVADDSGRKKIFLVITYVTCVAGTALLWYVTPGRVGLGLFLFVISFVGFSFGENLAAAFLPELSTPKNIGRISGFGWGLGYFGGLVCIVAVMSLLKGGYTLENLRNLRLAWVVTAVFFGVAALPTFLFLKERVPLGSGRAMDYVRAGFARIADTARSVRHFSELFRFLIVFFIFSMGLTAVIAFTAIFAERTLGFTAEELLYVFIAVQLTSAGGAFLFGAIQDRLGSARTIQMTLVLWVLVCIGTYFCTSKQVFWGLVLGAGLGIGSLQSASRGMVGLFSPPDKAGEFFGFWGLFGKGAYMLGPLVFGAISSGTGSQRLAILSTGLFFIAGLIGMAFIDEKRGHAEAEAWSRSHAS